MEFQPHDLKAMDDHHSKTAEKNTSHARHAASSHDTIPHIHFRTYIVVATVCLVYTAQVLHLVGTGAFGASISTTVGGQQDAFWLVAMCALETAVLSPPISQIADLWGRRWALIIPTLSGIVGSIIIARADSMHMVLGGNALVAASMGAQPLLHAVASEVMTHRNRVAAQAAVNVGSGMGGIIGLLAGAALTKDDPAGFRDFWYMTAGFFALGTLGVFFLYNPPLTGFQRSSSSLEKFKHLDWIGYILLACRLVLFMFGLSVAENRYPWEDSRTLAPLIIGIFVLGLFVLYEWRFKKDGMVHHDLFSRDRNFAIALFPYQVAVVYETNPIRVVLHFAVAFFVYITFVIAVAVYCYHTKKLRLPIVFAFVCFVAFAVCMSTTTPGSRTAVWVYPVFLGLGLAVALCALISAAQFSTPAHLIGTASGLMIAIRSFGGAIALAIYTAIFHSTIKSKVPSELAAAVVPLGLPEASLPSLIGDIMIDNVAGLLKVPGINPQIIGASIATFQRAFCSSVRYVWITAVAFAVLGLCVSCFIINPIDDFNLEIDAPAESQDALYGEIKKATGEEV